MNEKNLLSKNPFYSFVCNSNEDKIQVPDVSMFGMLKISAESHPWAVAVAYFGKKYSYKEVVEEVERISNAFYRLGVRRNDTVMILMPNTPAAVFGIYALNRLGAIADIVHPLSAREEIKRRLVLCKCKCLLCIDMCLEKISEIFDETYLESVITAGADDFMPLHLKFAYKLANKRAEKLCLKCSCISWQSFLNGESKKSPEYFPTGKENDKTAVILHSGGTTGEPKAIMLSNSNFNAFGIQSVATLSDVGVGDKILGVLPIFHGFGLGVCIHVCFCFGACSVLVPRFEAKKFGSLLKKYKPTMIFGVPTLYEALLKAKGIEKLDFSFLKYAVSGGDCLPKDLEERVNSFFCKHNSQVHISEGYGMTEGLAALSLSVNEAYKQGTVGKPLVGNKMCIAEPDTINTLGAGEVGELCVCGPTVMLGYMGNTKETHSTLKEHSDGKIWLHTGDMATIDEEGFVTYEFRLKRMIISSGYNVYPTYIEKTVEELPEVAKCVVVAKPHPYKKEVAKACIVLEDGYAPDSFTLEKIKNHCKKNLSFYSVPHEYEFVKEFSKTPYGKIDYIKLQDNISEM